MKIIVAGEWSFDIYEKAIASAFTQLGHDVAGFRIADYFANTQGDNGAAQMNIIQRVWYKFQYKYIIGPAVTALNIDFITLVRNTQPDLVFVYRGNYFFPGTIKTISETTGAKIVLYNNDDPFGTGHPAYLWRNFRNSLPFYDYMFAHREKNIEDYHQHGIRATSLLRSYYRKEYNYPINDIQDKRYLNKICFIGHYENDGRDEYLKYLLDAGVPLNIYGTLWENSPYYDVFCKKMKGPIQKLSQDYNLCINSNEIALAFFSKLNNDTYTRRCFEIPAAGTFLLSVYTDDMNSMFAAGQEADYFSSKEELLEKVNYYLANDTVRETIATNGYKRLLADGHEVVDRARQVIHIYKTELAVAENN